MLILQRMANWKSIVDSLCLNAVFDSGVVSSVSDSFMVTYFWSVWLGSGFMLLKCLVQIRFCLKYLTQIRFCFVEMFDRFGLVLLICLIKIRLRIIELSDSDPVLLLKYLPQIRFSVIKMSFSDPVLCYWNVWLGSEYMYWSFSSDPNPCYWKVLGTGSNAISALIKIFWYLSQIRFHLQYLFSNHFTSGPNLFTSGN